jgi:hypothetical protein
LSDCAHSGPQSSPLRSPALAARKPLVALWRLCGYSKTVAPKAKKVKIEVEEAEVGEAAGDMDAHYGNTGERLDQVFAHI